MSSYPVTHIRDSLPSLQKFGAAVEFFSDYVNCAPQPHGVDTLLVSLVVRGKGHHWMNDYVFPEQPGSVGITRCGEVHSIVTGPEGMDIYNLYLDPDGMALPGVPAELGSMRRVLFPNRSDFRHRLNRSLHLQFDDFSLPLFCIQTLHREMKHPAAGSAAVIEAMLRIFLIACCRNALEQGVIPSFSGNEPPPAWLMQTCRYLDEHYQEPVSLDLHAQRAGISRSHLCRAFKNKVGISVVDYYTERRIQAAMEQLQSTDDKVLAVALDSGFSDLSHFNRVFKRITGLSPTAFRHHSG